MRSGARRVAVSRPLGRSIDGCELKLPKLAEVEHLKIHGQFCLR